MGYLDDTIEFFITALKNYIKTSGKNQSSFSIEIKKSPGYISQVLNRKKRPSFDVREQIAWMCGYSDYFEMVEAGKLLKKGQEPLKIKTRKEHINLIGGFENQALGYTANKALLKIEKLDKNAFENIVCYIEGRADELEKTIKKLENEKSSGESSAI